MKRFHKFAFAATVAVYIQIFVGGLVRISGAGLGCPDWPTCFGRWIPPTDISQLPLDIDPAQFNFVLAWIEYINRLIGMAVGLLIAITAVWALVKMIKYPRVWIPAGLAALMVAYLGWQGGRMIEAQLEPFMVSIHMGLAFVVACLMIVTTQQAYYIEQGIGSAPSAGSGEYRLWVIILIAVSVVQVVLGTEVRTAMEAAASKYPLLKQTEWLNAAGVVNIVHAILGILVTLIAWWVGAGIRKRISHGSAMINQATWAMIILATSQTIFGILLILAGVPDLLQIYHLLLSSLFIGILILLFSALRYEGRTT